VFAIFRPILACRSMHRLSPHQQPTPPWCHVEPPPCTLSPKYVVVAVGTPQHHATKNHQQTQLEVFGRSVVRSTYRTCMTHRSTCRSGITWHHHWSSMKDKVAPPPASAIQHCSRNDVPKIEHDTTVPQSPDLRVFPEATRVGQQ
jgi:hypothetical protein